MSDIHKVAQLIALGISQRQVAAAIGVTDGRLSQLLAEDKALQALITENRQALAVKEVEKVYSLEQIEHNLIRRIDSLVEDVPSLGEAVSSLERLVKLKAIKASPDSFDGQPKRPTIFVGKLIQQQVNISLTTTNEVAALGERSMATMPTKQVLDLIKERTPEALEVKQDQDQEQARAPTNLHKESDAVVAYG